MARDAKYWVTRFGIYDGPDHSEKAEATLVRMGARAVPTLIATLGHREHGYRAAMLLAEIGLPAARPAIPALVRAAKTSKQGYTSAWAARALGAFGEIETLMAMAKHKRHIEDVVAGLKWARPASYAAYETLLARRDKTTAKLVATELAPGSASYTPTERAFDQLAAAASSSHAALRKDAAIALGELRAKKRIVPVLARLLADKDADVRRLAVMALGRCGVAARAVTPQIEKLLHDKNAKVRVWAKQALGKQRR